MATSNKKVKTVSGIVLQKGDIVDYQTVIEETIGTIISKLSCYDANWDSKSIIRGHKVNDKTRAYFIPDCDYEIIIRPIKRKSK